MALIIECHIVPWSPNRRVISSRLNSQTLSP